MITREWKDEQNKQMGHNVVCPSCKGAAQEPKVWCFQCTGWGLVRPGPDATCVHTWDRGVTVGNCLTLYTCTACNTKQQIDSSD